jgi:hypothetical protein
VIVRPTVRQLVILALIGALFGAGTVSFASGQDRGARSHGRAAGGRAERAARGRHAKTRTTDTTPTPAKTGGTGHDTSEHAPVSDAAEPDAPEGRDAEGADARSTIRSEGGQSVKVLEFSGLDVSGRLKSPQLLYFLNRVRAEFDRPRLPHRSFIGEMERSTHEKTF